MVLKIKSLPSFERRDHVEFKYILENEFWLSESAKKGAKPKNVAENDLEWPLGDLWGKSLPLVTKITVASDSLTSKSYEKWCYLLFWNF